MIQSELLLLTYDKTTEKFRQLCSNFDNQNVALNALISAYEIQQAKTVTTERQTDISDHGTYLQALQSAFLHSLELNENAKARIRQEFQRQFESKDNTIADLQERIKQAEANARVKQALNEIDSLKQQLANVKAMTRKAESELKEVKAELDRANSKHMAEVKELHQQLALQAKEADQKTALADLKEKYIDELNQLQRK